MKNRIVMVIAIALVIGVSLFRLWSPRRPRVVYQGKTAEQWLGEMFRGMTNQTAAMQAFRDMDTNGFPVLIEAFKKRDSVWSRSYAAIYRKLPASWRQHLARPVPIPELWSAAALVLLNNQAHAKKILPELARLLEDKSIWSRSYLVSVVCSLAGPEDTECVPALMSCVKDANAIVSFQAIEGLGHIGPGARDAVPVLTTALANSKVEVRLSAAWALWEINHETNLTVPVLRRALNFEEPSTLQAFRGPARTPKYLALVYLHEINPEDVSLIPEFIEELQSPNNNAPIGAIMTLGRYGSSASAAVPALTHLLNSQDLEIRQRVLEALKKIDPGTAAKYESN
jgi:hypothetical protein